MSLRFSLILVCVSILVGASFARAQDASTPPIEAAPQQVSDEAAILPVAKDPEARERRRTQFSPTTKERTKNLLDNVMNRLASATTRLDRIAVRIDARITKEETAGIDGTEAREALERARVEIDRARRESSMVTEVQMDLIVDSESPRVAFQNLYARIVTTRTALESAKRELGASLAALSSTPIVPTTGNAATSTEETATTTTP